MEKVVKCSFCGVPASVAILSNGVKVYLCNKHSKVLLKRVKAIKEVVV